MNERLTSIGCILALSITLTSASSLANKAWDQVRQLETLGSFGTRNDESFPMSSEPQLGRHAWSILRQAPRGIHLSIGSERSFLGAALNPNTTHLIVTDYDPEVLRYVRINRQLLKAETAATYRQLRFHANYEQWQALSSSLTSADHEWWVRKIRNFTNDVYDRPYPEMFNIHGKDIWCQRIRKVIENIGFIQQEASKSGNGPTFRHLFLRAKFSEIEALAKKTNVALTISRDDLSWWHDRYFHDYGHFHEWLSTGGLRNLIDHRSFVDYQTGSYVFDELLYARLHQLAMNDRIAALHLDLSKSKQVRRLVKKLSKLGQPLAVLDLDNLYYSGYAGPDRYRELIREFAPLAVNPSILLVMINYMTYGAMPVQSYLGFRYSHISQWPRDFDMLGYLRSLPQPLLHLVNGMLYGPDNHPPYWDTWQLGPKNAGAYCGQ